MGQKKKIKNRNKISCVAIAFVELVPFVIREFFFLWNSVTIRLSSANSSICLISTHYVATGLFILGTLHILRHGLLIIFHNRCFRLFFLNHTLVLIISEIVSHFHISSKLQGRSIEEGRNQSYGNQLWDLPYWHHNSTQYNPKPYLHQKLIRWIHCPIICKVFVQTLISQY